MEPDEEYPDVTVPYQVYNKEAQPVVKKYVDKRVPIKLNVRVISPQLDREEDFDIPQKVYREPSRKPITLKWSSSELPGSRSPKGQPTPRKRSRPSRRHTIALLTPAPCDETDPSSEEFLEVSEKLDITRQDIGKNSEIINIKQQVKTPSSQQEDKTASAQNKYKQSSVNTRSQTTPSQNISRSNTVPAFTLDETEFKKFTGDNGIRHQPELYLKHRSHTTPFDAPQKPRSFWKHLDRSSVLVRGKDRCILYDCLPKTASGDYKVSLSDARRKSLKDNCIYDCLPKTAPGNTRASLADARRRSVTQSGLWQLASASVYEMKAKRSREFGDIAMAVVTRQIAVDKMRHKIEKKMDLPEGRFARIAALKQKMETIEKRFKTLKLTNACSKGGVIDKEDSYDTEESRQPKFSKPGQAVNFFRKCSRMIMIVLKWIDLIMNDQNRLEKELKSFVDIANEVEESTVSQAMLDSGLTFDKNLFKARREISLTAEHRKILTTRWNCRTPEMIQQVMHGLQTLRSLSEYPLHTQQKLCKVAWYQTIGSRKAIVRQGHKAESFYFVLSGVAYVKKLTCDEKTGDARASTLARLTRGMSFGEIGLIFNTLRTATVESATPMELLVIGKEDFNRIFMKAENPDEEAEHVQFLRQVPMMQAWPIEKLHNEPGSCLLHFFKRGTLVAEDGKTSEWLYFIKSGTCEVLKRLKSTKPKKAGQGQRKLDPMCDVILPELGNTPSPRVNTGQQRKRKEFRMSPEVFNDMSKYYDKLKKKILVEQGRDRRLEAPTSESESVTLLPRLMNGNPSRPLVTVCEEDEAAETESRVHSGYSSVTISGLMLPPHTCTMPTESPGISDSPIEKYTQSTLGKLKPHFMFPSSDQIESEKPSPRDSPDFQDHLHSQRENIFVMIELLHPKDAFGINTLTGWGSDDIDDMLNDSPPTALVSNGAEIVMLSKKVFMKYINDDVRCMLRENVRAYPKETVMQDNLQRKLDWDEYKSTIISDWVTSRSVLREINCPG